MKLFEVYKKLGVKGPRYLFPSPLRAGQDGLVCMGGDLEPDTLITAYAMGLFPWTYDPITWWSPNPRAIFNIDTFTLNKRRLRYLKKSTLTFTLDRAFKQVITGCAAADRGGEGTWITPEFIAAYTKMYNLGFAHSAEAWCENTLVGGVYGIALGGLFAGESMFSTLSNASSFALYYLIKHLRQRGFVLFDSQEINSHTRLLGAAEISKTEYLQRLKRAIKLECEF